MNSLGLAVLYSYAVPLEKMSHLHFFSFLVLDTVKCHGLFQFCRNADQVCRENLHGKPVKDPAAHGGTHHGVLMQR